MAISGDEASLTGFLNCSNTDLNSSPREGVINHSESVQFGYTSVRELEERHMEDNGNGLGYFLLGLGVGVAAGMLLAPKAGDETREIIRTKAGEGARHLRARASDGAEFVKRRGADLKDTAEDLLDRGKSTIGQSRDRLAAAVDAGKSAYREAVSNFENAGGEGV